MCEIETVILASHSHSFVWKANWNDPYKPEHLHVSAMELNSHLYRCWMLIGRTQQLTKTCHLTT